MMLGLAVSAASANPQDADKMRNPERTAKGRFFIGCFRMSNLPHGETSRKGNCPHAILSNLRLDECWVVGMLRL